MECPSAISEHACRLMIRTTALLGLGLLLVAGCGQRNYSGPRRYALEGKVTIDGQPIDFGSISFLPAAGGSERVSGGLITDGVYSVPEEMGANAGAYRVEIRWRKTTGKKLRDPDSGEMYDERKEGLPPRYHTDSQLTAEVSEKQTRFDFDLKSAP
jgi:hypothetical protein